MLNCVINNKMTRGANLLPFLTNNPYYEDMSVMAKNIILKKLQKSQINKDQLISLYVDNELSQKDCGIILGVSASTKCSAQGYMGNQETKGSRRNDPKGNIRTDGDVKGKQMPENMMCPDHKATNETYRTEYDRIFREGRFLKLPDIMEACACLLLPHEPCCKFYKQQEDTDGKTKRV